jgi:hypothetical protein
MVEKGIGGGKGGGGGGGGSRSDNVTELRLEMKTEEQTGRPQTIIPGLDKSMLGSLRVMPVACGGFVVEV